MISGALGSYQTWGVVTFHGESDEEGWEEFDFLKEKFPELDSICHLTPAGEPGEPGPKPRSEWQRIDLGN